MSLIHQALKKVEKDPSERNSSAAAPSPVRVAPAPKRKRFRLFVLVGLNCLGAAYIIWSLQGNGLPHPRAVSAATNETAPASIETGEAAAAAQLATLEGRAAKAYQAGDYRMALPLWEKLILRDSLNPEHYNNLGLVMKRLGRWEEAIEQYRKAVSIDPQYATAYNNMGALYLARGNTDEAQRYLQKAAEIDPANADPHLNLGYLFEMRGDHANARQAYQTFLDKLTNLDDPLRADVEDRLAVIAPVGEELL